MKIKLFWLTLSLVMISCTPSKESGEKSEQISFVSIVDINNATKDGVYMNGYVVFIEYDRIKKLNGKKVKITGEVVVIKGTNNQSKKEGDEIVSQGRSKDIKHIKSPTIEIVSN